MDSSILKIQRAEKHYTELSELLTKHKPFRYFVETNFKTGKRATFAKRDEETANHAAIIIGDLIHNLRAALDHTYWECTESFAKSEGERRQIQFKIVSTEKAFKESEMPGLPLRVSERFASALASLKPYRKDGNDSLCLIHDLDVVDKHKLLIPTGNFTKISSAMIRMQVPDFPPGLTNCDFGNNGRDVVWPIRPITIEIQKQKEGTDRPSQIVERELEVTVEVVLADVDAFRPALEVLQEMIATTKEAHQVLKSAI